MWEVVRLLVSGPPLLLAIKETARMAEPLSSQDTFRVNRDSLQRSTYSMAQKTLLRVPAPSRRSANRHGGSSAENDSRTREAIGGATGEVQISELFID